VDILLKEPVGLDKLLGGVEKIRSSHVARFKIHQVLFFFLIAHLFIFTDSVAFVIQIGKDKIPMTAASQEIDAFFSEFHGIASLVNGAIEDLIQFRQDFLRAHHALGPVNLLFQCRIF